MFRKLEEMSKVRPIALQPKQRPARLDYFRGKKLSDHDTMLILFGYYYFFVGDDHVIDIDSCTA